MKNAGFVEVYRAETAPEAHLVRDQLEAFGIPARVEGDFLQGALGGLAVGWSTEPRILVAEPDAAAAKKFIKSLERETKDSPTHD